MSKFKSLAKLTSKILPSKISEFLSFGSKTHTPKVKGIPYETIIKKIDTISNKYNISIIHHNLKDLTLSKQILKKIASIFTFRDNKLLLSPQTEINDLLSLSINKIKYSIAEFSLSSN